jgi:Holliday junction resolvase RusA-like endonuclease
VIQFSVTGDPVPQGSMMYYNGHMVHQKSKELKAWRQRVGATAQPYFSEPLDEAVTVTMVFHLKKPPSVTRQLPSAKPDLDKLVRAVLDGLTQIAFPDDSRVTKISAEKRYGTFAGVDIEVTSSVTYITKKV